MLIGLIISLAVVAAAVLFSVPALITRGRRPVLDLSDPEEKRRRSAFRLRVVAALVVVLANGPIEMIVGARRSMAAVVVLWLVVIVSLGVLVYAVGIYPRRR